MTATDPTHPPLHRPPAEPSHASPLKPGANLPDVDHSDRPMNTIYIKESALALRQAWGIYFVFAAVPPLVMIATIFFLILWGPGSGVFGPRVIAESPGWGWTWLLVGMFWLSITVPLTFWVRRGFWREYYSGGTVRAADYLKGNVAIWMPLVIAGVMGFVGFAATRYVASLFTSVMAFIIFLTLFPNGHAMTRAVGDHDDPGVYEEPR